MKSYVKMWGKKKLKEFYSFFMFILLILIFSLNVQAENHLYYKIKVNYLEDNLEIKDISVVISPQRLKNFPGNYRAHSFNPQNGVLNITLFGIPHKVFQDFLKSETNEIASGDILDFKNGSFELFVPYYPQASKLIILNPNRQKIITEDLSDFFQPKCGDGFCQKFESSLTCRIDCKSGKKDDYCNRLKDGICDPDCTENLDPDCNYLKKNNEKVNSFLKKEVNYLLVFVIILVIIIFFSVFKKKKIITKFYKKD